MGAPDDRTEHDRADETDADRETDWLEGVRDAERSQDAEADRG